MSNSLLYANLCSEAVQFQNDGNIDSSLQIAHNACALVPSELNAYHIIASSLMLKEDWLSALETYELAWLLNPNDSVTNGGVQYILQKLRDVPVLTSPERPLPELGAFGFYSKACRRLSRVGMYRQARTAYQYTGAESSNVSLRSVMMNVEMEQCDWSHFDANIQMYLEEIKAGRGAKLAPFLSLCATDNPEIHLACAKQYLGEQQGHFAVQTRKLRPLGKLTRKPRIGYISSDYHNHPTSRLMVGMLEDHSHAEYEIVGISYGPNDNSGLRERVVSAFDDFIDISSKSIPGEAKVKILKSLNLDILVDAKGLTGDFDGNYTISRPAPVIVNFLAYPGSMGSTAYDYIIGDQYVTPFEHQPYFSECIVQLPHSYQCNDSRRQPPAAAPSRTDVGIPNDAIILAAFNNTRKITPGTFDAWMRILQQVPAAVLWLLTSDVDTRHNLSASAKLYSIDLSRLIFSEGCPPAQHMARYELVNLFLDTFPYNAHTTASDALWMGVPLVTLQGKSFASRVASGLLHNVGCGELVTYTLDEFVSKAVEICTDNTQRALLKNRLLQQSGLNSIYNSKKYALNIEQAYSFMIDRSRKGKPPHPFAVRDIDDGGGVCLANQSAFKAIPKLFR